MKQNSEIILDSIINGERVTTFRYEIWRSLLPEVLTYRSCARSAASSRAIPAHINIERVRTEPFVPTYVGKEHKGMSPSEFLTGDSRVFFENNWSFCASEAANRADTMLALGVSKSIINRILEPYNTINVLMTGATHHWEWLFKQRTAADAEPNLRELVLMMQEQYNASEPVERKYHLPFATNLPFNADYEWERTMRISAARCARLSYTPHGSPKTDVEADLALANKLLKSKHFSPFEHQLFPDDCHSGMNAISPYVCTFRQLLGQ